jgi:purine-binding chemotaxis protein CheW
MSLDIEGKYLTFGLAKQEYGARILSVKEIIGMIPIRALPQTPPFFKGVLNFRDKVIPVIDPRLKFGVEELEYNERTCYYYGSWEK